MYKTGEKVIVSIKRSTAKMIGHGDTHNSITISKGEQTVCFEDGDVYQVSENTKYPVCNLEASPIPLVRADIVNSDLFNPYFKHAEKQKEE